MPKFIAQRACIAGSKRFSEGDRIETDNVVPCDYCDGKGEFKGKECPKCHGTKRSFPPHHFVEVKVKASGEVETVELDSQNPDADLSDIGKIRKEIKDLGGDFDRRWKLPRLQEELLKLQKEKGK